MNKLTGIILAVVALVIPLTVLPSIPAAAVASPHTYCTYALNNGALHPTWKVNCYETKRTYRALAWCQTAWAYGNWAQNGGTSTAQCFFLFVDRPKSTMQWGS
jgi:hypothetical protein